MKTSFPSGLGSQHAYALLMVMVIIGVALLIFSSAANWTSSSALVTDRNNTYNAAVAAAEGASERALSYLARDFFNQSFDPAQLSTYQAVVPTNAWASAYEFSDGEGAVNHTWVSSSALTVTTNLESQFAGLYGLAYSCTVRSNAKPLGTPYEMAGAVEQEVQLAAIPVFQFAIFYNMDLEINPGPEMKITGKVHGNANLYTAPQTGLEYVDAVTAVGKIYNNREPGDPTGGGSVAPVYDAEHVGGVSSLTLPVGTNNSPAQIEQILQKPPLGESPQSETGSERYYNKSDLVVTTTATGVTVTTGDWDSFAHVTADTPGTNSGYSFVNTNATFFDQRENKWTQTTEIDVGKLNKWLTNGGAAINAMANLDTGHQLSSVYVDDQRVVPTKLTSVRVVDGQQLPPDGLTVATKLPLYVEGQYNAPDTTPGSTNTSNTKPASLLGDAITVLSANWSDANSSQPLSQRPAVNTTVNAAFLAGIVQTTNSGGGHYSGGVENFPRFLEDWNSKTFTYNGSMVVMFPSQYATSFWIAPGTYYNAPNRKWAFDLNFKDYHKLPPATPQVRQLIRGQWSVIAATAAN